MLFDSACNYTAAADETVEVLAGNVKTTLDVAGWCAVPLCTACAAPGLRGMCVPPLPPPTAPLPCCPAPAPRRRPFCSASNQLVVEMAFKSTKLGKPDAQRPPSVQNGTEVEEAAQALRDSLYEAADAEEEEGEGDEQESTTGEHWGRRRRRHRRRVGLVGGSEPAKLSPARCRLPLPLPSIRRPHPAGPPPARVAGLAGGDEGQGQ